MLIIFSIVFGSFFEGMKYVFCFLSSYSVYQFVCFLAQRNLVRKHGVQALVKVTVPVTEVILKKDSVEDLPLVVLLTVVKENLKGNLLLLHTYFFMSSNIVCIYFIFQS